MSLEGFSKKGMELGNNPEGINETINTVRRDYLTAIKRLALQKMKNGLMFEEMLGAIIRRFSSLGLDVSRESIFKDLEVEVNKQKAQLDFDIPDISLDSKSEINQLKNNLRNIFESTSTQEQKPANMSGAIPREPAIQSPGNYGIPRNNLVQINEQPIKSEINYTEQEKQEIIKQLKQEQQKLSETLEWAKQQPNEPAFTSNRSENISPLPEWAKDTGVSGYQEPTDEDKIQRIKSDLENSNNVWSKLSGIDKNSNEFYESFDTIYQNELNRLYQLKTINSPDFENELNKVVGNIVSITDKIPNAKGQLMSDLEYMSHQKLEQSSESSKLDNINNEIRTSQIFKEQMQEQDVQMKNNVINEIISTMLNTGEFNFGDPLDVSSKMNAMNNVKNKLENKSMDELQMLLATYQDQNVQEETMSSGIHR